MNNLDIANILKEKRQNLGIAAEEISQKLKVKTQDIIAFEQNKIELISPKLYLVGFVIAYANLLKIDDKIIDQYKKNSSLSFASNFDHKRQKHQLINLDLEDSKAPNRDDVVNALLIVAIIFLLLVSLSQFRNQNSVITEIITTHLNQAK